MNNEFEITKNINLNNNIDNNLDNLNTVTLEKQKSFLESNLGQVINGGIDLGLRALLPDFIEDQIIEVKDSILTEGFSSGIKTAIDNVVDMGKSVLGIFTGKFENLSQVKNVIKKGGLIDSVSDVLNWGINKSRENGLINSSIANVITKGKNTILNIVSDGIENNLTSQLESIEKIDRYTSNWKSFFQKKDFTDMEKEYKKIEKELKNIMPLENVINNAKRVENLHKLIKNNGKNFNLSNEELELANKLI